VTVDDELGRRRRERAAAAAEPALAAGLDEVGWSPRFPAAVLLARVDPLLGDFRGLSLRARALYVVLTCLGPRRDLVDVAEVEAAAPELAPGELAELLAELRGRSLLGSTPGVVADPGPPAPRPA